MTWEQRWHPLREEWVIVAAHRQARPWRGETVEQKPRSVPPYDPECAFCPGNVRVNGQRNPRYPDTFAFDNDHPCVGEAAPLAGVEPPVPYARAPATGVARVVCWSPRHDLSLAQLDDAGVERCLSTLQQQCAELGARPEVAGILAFENRGEVVGVSNPHPHGQVYATSFVFPTFAREAQAAARHRASTGSGLLADMIAAERRDGRRILFDAEQAIAFVPYCARWAYEVWVAPARAWPDLAAVPPDGVKALAAVLRAVLVKLDGVWGTPMPYVLVLHQAPVRGEARRAFHFHVEIHPPLRAPGLRKYLAGPEVGGGGFLSDTSPEERAEELRRVVIP